MFELLFGSGGQRSGRGTRRPVYTEAEQEERRRQREMRNLEHSLRTNVCFEMDKVDGDHQAELRPTSCRKVAYYFQMWGCLIETPIHLMWHSLLYLVFCVAALLARSLAFIVAFFEGVDNTENVEIHPCFAGMLVCIGSEWYLSWFLVNFYRGFLWSIIGNLCHPCDPVVWLYEDRFIPLKRPPFPKLGGGRYHKCCGCLDDLNACCECRNCDELGQRLGDALLPIGAARRCECRFTRSLFFSLSGPHALHPALLCGPCCACCRRLYDDFDERGLKWLDQREKRQAQLTREFYLTQYPEEKPETWEQLLAMRTQQLRDQHEAERLEARRQEEAAAAAAAAAAVAVAVAVDRDVRQAEPTTQAYAEPTSIPRVQALFRAVGRFFTPLPTEADGTPEADVADLEAPPPAAPKLEATTSQARGRNSYLATQDGLTNGARRKKEQIERLGAVH